ncbi:phosphopantetheine-binding protein [Streptosporangium sp. NPDC051022]|uniref:phosphopantetheine-binding protein n=1 Tax=Streptosporangium sp. NPDC051022 TaxID=3155752 RepID=UPI0034290840
MTDDHIAAAERRVEQIWKDVLGLPEARPDATFFESGGQSIAAVRIVARIEKELGVDVDMGDLFEDPDLATFRHDVAVKAGSVAREDARSA